MLSKLLNDKPEAKIQCQCATWGDTGAFVAGCDHWLVHQEIRHYDMTFVSTVDEHACLALCEVTVNCGSIQYYPPYQLCYLKEELPNAAVTISFAGRISRRICNPLRVCSCWVLACQCPYHILLCACAVLVTGIYHYMSWNSSRPSSLEKHILCGYVCRHRLRHRLHLPLPLRITVTMGFCIHQVCFLHSSSAQCSRPLGCKGPLALLQPCLQYHTVDTLVLTLPMIIRLDCAL